MTDAELYTSVAESIEPGSAVELMNRYFAALFHPVYARGGFVADLKGDGMLAVWVDGATPTELKKHACLACLEIAASARQFSQANGALGFATRIGACFGALALASLGTPAHHEYRAVGDTVNISSRLEQLNKDLGTRILVCADLAAELDEFLFRDLGRFQLRGKANQVHVKELISLRSAATGDHDRLCLDFSIALGHYRQGRIDRALERFADLYARFPGDGPTRFYLERCRSLASERVRVPRYWQADPLPVALG